MDLELSGKVFLISGGASGIGAGIVAGLESEGARAISLDRNVGAGEHSIQLDLCIPEAVSDAVSAVVREHGRIDGVINNAGINDGASLAKGLADFDQSLRRNLHHAFQLVHESLPHLKEHRGVILNIGSKVFATGQGGTSGYAAAKGALAALTREWALDLAAEGIRCNAIIPAEVWTPMYQEWLSTREDPAATRLAIESRIPLDQRMTSIEEIANTALFLLSPKSSHTTGQLIHVDGGYTHLDRAFP